jgi:hypothetical protein
MREQPSYRDNGCGRNADYPISDTSHAASHHPHLGRLHSRSISNAKIHPKHCPIGVTAKINGMSRLPGVQHQDAR